MKRYQTAAWALCLCLAGAYLTGCANTEETSSSQAETTAETTTTAAAETTTAMTTTTEPEEAAYKIIGTEAEGEGIYAIHLTNQTGMEITNFAMEDGAQYSEENMLEDGDPFVAEEERILYVDTNQAQEDGDEMPSYVVSITVEGDMVYQMHVFPYEDMTDAKLCLEEGIAYLMYTDIETQEEVSTAEEERAVQAELAAQAEAAEAEAARQAEEEAQNAVEQQQVAIEENAQNAIVEQQQQEEQEQQPAEEQPVVTEAPVEETPAADPNEGCIGDEGLFY